MFQLIEELWKAQQYCAIECSFQIPQTFNLQGKNLHWYFSSGVCPGKIVKKRKVNVNLQSIANTFNSTEQYVASMTRLIQKDEAHMKYLKVDELSVLLKDAENYPNLYKDVIIQQTYPSDTYISYHRKQHVTIIKQQIPLIQKPLITLKDEFYTTENITFENRVTRAAQQIETMIRIIMSKDVIEIELLFKYQDNKLIIMWCPKLQTSNSKCYITYVHTANYLYNQALYDKHKPQLCDIDKMYLIQCGCCNHPTCSSQRYQVMQDKLWKIRMHRGLHHLNDQKLVITQAGQVKLIRDKFEFVNVCTKCYDAFLEIIKVTIETPSKISKQVSVRKQSSSMRTTQRSPQKQSNQLNSTMIFTRNDKKLNSNISKTRKRNSQSLQQKSEIEMEDEFDKILNNLLVNKQKVQNNSIDQWTVESRRRIHSSFNPTRQLKRPTNEI